LSGCARKTVFLATGLKKRERAQWDEKEQRCGRDNLRAVRVHLTPGRVSLMHTAVANNNWRQGEARRALCVCLPAAAAGWA